MKKKPNHGFIKRCISIFLVLSIISVTVAGDNYALPVTSEQTKSVADSEAQAQTVSYTSDLKSMDELELAGNATAMAQTSESLQDALVQMPETVKNDKEANEAALAFGENLDLLKKAALEELEQTDNGSDEFNDYKAAIMSGFEELENEISKVNAENYESVLANISQIINPETPYTSLADDLPFSEASEENISYEDYNPESVTDYQVDDSSYSSGDLEQTNDTATNDEITEAFSEMESVLEVYQYIKNNYKMEFYYGSRKGAVGTFAEKAGNDYDIASLLIGVLRDRNIPARYVKGKIEITAEQAMEWTATDDVNVAMRMISALGIPTTGMISDGETVAVRLEHVWVEAYVPYTDYRGTGNRSGERLWIPLDASFKKMIPEDGVSLEEISGYFNDSSNQITSSTEINGVNIGELANLTEDGNSALMKYMLENGYGEATLEEAFGGKSIVTTDLGYLPLTLQYSIADNMETFDDIPLSLTDSVQVRLYGNSATGTSFSGADSIDYTYYAPDVYGKRIVLSYVPATEADEAVIEKYGDIFSAPAYLLKLTPQLVIDGEVVAEGSVCNAGYMQKYTITVHNGAKSSNDSDISNTIEAGGMYSIAMDYGNISGDELQAAAEYINSKKDSTNEDNIYSEEVMGEILNTTSKLYFAQLDLYNRIIAGQTDVTATRALSIGIVGFKINVQYLFNRPAELNEGGIFLDIGHDVHSVISNTSNNEDEKIYMLQAGMYASAMEHGVLEQVTGVESVSTIKTFQYSQENDIPIHVITKDNLSEELAAINVSSQTVTAIRTSVNSGKTVIIPEETITINQWSGEGYMVLDPDTFACGYMISGGKAGGSMTIEQMIGEYISYVVQGALFVLAWECSKTILLSVLPCGWVSAISFLISVTEIVMMMDYVSQLVDLWNMYHATGEIKYLQELGVQVAAFATLSIASKFFKNEITQLKEKISQAVDEAGLAGTCFVAGTLILTSVGLTPIEDISAGTMVYSFDPDTLCVSQKEVEETFVKESNRLIDIQVNGETIKATPDHPFYVPQKGFTRAIELRAGDELCTVNGEYVVIEKIQHEILESPVKVYNFRVADYHTYYVGESSIAVHNAICAEKLKFGSDTKSSERLSRQMEQRGWTKESIIETVENPAHTSPATNKANGNPATAYFNADGSYVVVDNVTFEIVQISKVGDTGWIPDPSITDPYVPEGGD
jgi:transglutaminase-like putative cysteine protease